MSGGVDSSVAAALLKEQGYNCIGAYFLTWTEQTAGLTMCPWEQEAADARQVCGKLGIPFYTFDFEKEYKRNVVDYLFKEYEAGRTPNPDILCNRDIKFDLFLNKAKEIGADFIATGHYAHIKHGKHTSQLYKGKDNNKDQSYFLYALNQHKIRHALFPLGKLTKDKVRTIAEKYSLHIAKKKDSQGICFLGQVDLKDFLKTRIPTKKGDILTTTGEIIGQHEGIMYYTIGQRHGIPTGGGTGEPLYVIDKDITKNILIVGTVNDPQLFSKEIIVTDLHWTTLTPPNLPLKCKAKIRYRQDDQSCTVARASDGNLKVIFKKPQRAVALGQSCVLYKGKKLLGGGVIQEKI